MLQNLSSAAVVIGALRVKLKSYCGHSLPQELGRSQDRFLPQSSAL